MVFLPWDTLFLAGFAYSGYRTLGRWVKYTEDTAKAQSDGGYIDGFREFLGEAAAAGDRPKATPGAGADASGQSHLWRDWNGMKTKQRLALLEEMHKVLEWTGQDGVYRVLKQYAGVPWSQLPHKAKKELLVAADQLDWSFVKHIEQEGSALGSNSRLWQLNEAIPALSVEPALAEALIEEAEDLKTLVSSADAAVNELLTSQQGAVIAALSPAQELQVLEARRKVDLLREAAQGGLGLGSGGKAARGQQLLELIRGISLIPSDAAAAAARSAAAAALDDQADQAVAGLRDQHEKALAAAVAAARGQSMGAALAKRIRFNPGKPTLSAATAAAVIDLAADELAAAVAALDKADGLVAKRNAAESLMTMSGIIDSTAAALAAAAADDHDDDDDDHENDLSDLAEKLVTQTTELAQLKLRGPTTPAAATESSDSAAPATTPDQDAAAAVHDALQAVRSAAAAAAAAKPAAAEGEGSSDAAAAGSSAESVRESVLHEVNETVKQVEERTKASQETALQNARSRERMSLLLAKAKQITTPPATAAGDESAATTDAESSPAMSSAEKLAVTEEYLKQLGTRPLAAAVTDLNKLVAAAGDEGASGLSWGLTLEPASLNSLKRLGDLLSEIDLAESVMSLELGPNITNTLQMLNNYMERVRARHKEEEEKRAAGVDSEEGDDSAGTPKNLGVSPNQIKEAEAIDKCSSLIDDLNKDCLVVLGLTGAQYRQLAQLKEAVGALTVGMDALKYDRCVSALKEVSAQLGPIGAAIQVKLADTTDESTRGLMSKQKTLAVELYQKLQAFLSFEDNVRGPLKHSLRELASLAGGIGAPRTTSGCEAATLKLEMAEEEAQQLQEALAHLATSSGETQQAGDASGTPGPSADSVGATQQIVDSLQGSIESLQASLSNLTAHVALRVRAMNSEVAAAAAAAAGVEGTYLDLNTLEDMTPELDHPLHILGNASDEQQAAWEHTGFEQIARGRVAAVLITTSAADAAAAATAGAADGTPRVALAVAGLPSGKSVLQLNAERILRLQRLAATSTFGKNAPVSRQIHWYIMTSPATHDKLSATVKSHGYYGLNPNQVHIFECKTAPPAFAGEPLKALTLGSATLSRGVPGSGEVFATLKRSGALGHMKRSGVRHVEINAVDDNILARSADPMFIGFCIDSGLDGAAKVVEPQSVAPVYAAVMSGSSAAAAEGEEAAAASDLEENIGFLAPAIGSYYFSFAALNKAATYYDTNPLAMYRMVPNAKLPSKAPAPAMTVNLPPNATQAQRMQAQQAIMAAQHAAAAAPAKPVEGYVPTRVISDIFCAQGSGPLAGASLAYLGVDKEEEFSPLFGGGPHLITPEPEIAAGDLLALTTGWVENQGAVVQCEEGVEVSPLISYAGEGLEALASEGHIFVEPYEISLQGASDEGRAKHNAGAWAAPVLLAYAVGAGLAAVKQIASK